jgi:type VI secretion system secreted protein VgrG
MAGRKWGFMAIPRIGQEVVVEFLEGDPDRPLIVGSVYNSDQMPHYDPKEHKTRTYFKTNSTKGGDGFNELMFEDQADKEMVFIHAERNMDVRVKNNSTETIVGNRYQRIGWEKDGKKSGDQSELVWQDKHLNIKRNQVEKIEGNLMLTVGHGEADMPGEVDFEFEKIWRIKVGEGGRHTSIGGHDNKEIGGSKSLLVKGDLVYQADNSMNFDAATDFNNKAGMNYSLDAGMDINAKAGMMYNMEAGMNMHLKSGLSMVIESGLGLCLKVGGSFITINPAGIFISGPMVMINSGGAALSGPGCSPTSPYTPEQPDEAKQAEPMDPPMSHDEKTGQKSN